MQELKPEGVAVVADHRQAAAMAVIAVVEQAIAVIAEAEQAMVDIALRDPEARLTQEGPSPDQMGPLSMDMVLLDIIDHMVVMSSLLELPITIHITCTTMMVLGHSRQHGQ